MTTFHLNYKFPLARCTGFWEITINLQVWPPVFQDRNRVWGLIQQVIIGVFNSTIGRQKGRGSWETNEQPGMGEGGGLGMGRQRGSRTKCSIFVFLFLLFEWEECVIIWEIKVKKYAVTVFKKMTVKTQQLYLTITHRHSPVANWSLDAK